MNLSIGNRVIKKGVSPFIIAEAGINHNGNIDNAMKMISAANKAGADAIKFQTFKANELIVDESLTYTYKSQGQEVTKTMLELFTQYELSREDWFDLKKYCDDLGIIFLSTPQNYTDLELLLEVGIDVIKVGSDDFTNIPLLKKYKEVNKPLILSCGMADLSDIDNTLNAVGALDGYPVILLLCVSEYPTPIEHVNLLRLKTLQNTYPDMLIGFSDHTESFLAATLATALGACVIEKHFTLDKTMAGPDHWFSEDPSSLKIYVSQIRQAFQALGSSLVKPTEKEFEMRGIARRSVVAIADISEGELLTEKNIGLRRPGNGIPPKYFSHIIGMKSSKVIKRGSLLDVGDFYS